MQPRLFHRNLESPPGYEARPLSQFLFITYQARYNSDHTRYCTLATLTLLCPHGSHFASTPGASIVARCSPISILLARLTMHDCLPLPRGCCCIVAHDSPTLAPCPCNTAQGICDGVCCDATTGRLELVNKKASALHDFSHTDCPLFTIVISSSHLSFPWPSP